MTNTIAGTYSTLVTLSAAIDNPTTISASGLLNYGLQVSYPSLAVVNAGRITNRGEGIFLLANGSVINQSGGTISGEQGIYARYASTVVNAGYIAGYGGSGVSLSKGGSVTNQSGGVISGYNGIEVDTGAGTVVNAGRIGGTRGVYSWGASLTVVNAGTITGSHAAVQFAAGFVNRLVIDPNAVFSGQVTGGNAIGAAHVSTLELDSAGSAGTLSGLGTQFVDFAQVTVDAGAQWTLAGANTIAAGYTLIDAGTLTNAGTFSGELTLAAGGVLSNVSTGTITESGWTAVYGATGGAATVVNAGVIADTDASGDRGIDLTAGGGVINQSGGTISGYDGISASNYAVTVVNAGSISVSSEGIYLDGGGSITNQSGGVISGFDGIYGWHAAVTVVNAGTIAGAGYGVGLVGGGSVTNQSGGVISGHDSGIRIRGAVTVVNAGTIAGNVRGVYFEVGSSGGSVTNQSGGTISGEIGVYGRKAAVTVVNAGSISVSSEGVDLSGGGSVTNQSGGMISGKYGIDAVTDAVTVVNAGSVTGSSKGVALRAGGSVTNQSGGTISGSEGIYGWDAAVTVVNAGTITGSAFYGISLLSGGSVTSQSGGTISGRFEGIVGEGGAVTVVNAGTIAGGTLSGEGMSLWRGGSITNQSGGVISGYFGIYGLSDAVTVVNAGTIAASSYAVKFAAGFANRLIADPGAVFAGNVNGGGGVLELASAASAGTLSGLGTQFIDFAQVTVDTGAQWTLQATDTIEAGVTLTNAGTLSGPLTLAVGGVLSNASTGTITTSSGAVVYGATGGAATVVNAGVIAGYDGSSGRGIVLAAGGSVTNQSGGAISGSNGIYGENAAVTVVNAGTITGTNYAVSFEADFANRLVIDPDAVFSGTLTGGNTLGASIVSTLELGSGASTGTLAGLGSQYVNFGSIAVDGGANWVLAGSNTFGAGGILANDGTLTLTGSLVNAGTITGVPNAAGGEIGIGLETGGSLTNQAGGTISGYIGVYAYGTAAIVNTGSIGGDSASRFGDAMRLSAGGSVYNQSGGTISGYEGVFAVNVPVTVLNAGYIGGTSRASSAYGVYLGAGGTVTNLATGTISGGIVAEDAPATVMNYGLVAAEQAGVFLIDGGSITNQAGGTIGGGEAVLALKDAATVENVGTIIAPGTGVDLLAGGAVTNQTGGTISGYVAIDGGNYPGGQSLTVVNYGLISGGQPVTVTSGTVSHAAGIVASAGGYVINHAGATISGYTGIYAPGSAATVINAGSILGSNDSAGSPQYETGIFLMEGGSVTNQSGGTISGAIGILTFGAATVVNAGSIGGSSYAVKFVAESANRLIADPGSVFTGKVSGGGGVLELASAASAGTLSGFGTSITTFGSLQFDSGAAWTVSGTYLDSGLGTIAITGFANGDTIDLTGFVATGETFANNTLVLTNGTVQAMLNIEGDFTSSSFQLSSDGNGGTDIVICFVAGTRIGTPDGEVPVGQLKTGDLVLTAHNGPRTVKWIGKGKVLATRGRRSAATPVIVRKGALADNVPNRDLHVTKAHSLYIDDVLIPVEFLVNHRTILWDDRAQEVTIYHVELDSHDVLIANGALAESYRDDGNRWLFQNANADWHLPPQEPYAPVLTGGPVVDAAWRLLLDRAGPSDLPSLTEDPDLHLVIDGVRVDPEYRHGSLHGFRLPCSPKSVVIASRAGVPSELGIARDPRPLGVALRQVAVRQGGKFMLLDADDDRLTVGFHAYEADCRLRWTDGWAALPAAAFARFDKGAEVMLHLGGATQYPDGRASPAQAAA